MHTKLSPIRRWLLASLALLLLWQPSALAQSGPTKGHTKVTKKRIPPLKERTPAQKANEKKRKKPSLRGLAKMKLRHWLVLGPGHTPLPAFHKEKYGRYKARNLLTHNHLQIYRLHPKEGKSYVWFLDQPLHWRRSSGQLKTKGAAPQVAYLATYLEVDRYLQLTLKLRSHQRLRVFLDGRPVANKYNCTPLPKKRKYNQRKAHTSRAKKPRSKGKKASTRRPKARPSSRPAPSQPSRTQDANSAVLRLTELLAKQLQIIQSQSRTIRQQLQQLNKLAQQRQPQNAPRRRRPGQVRATLRLTPGVHLLVIKTLYTPECVPSWSIQGSLHKTKKSAIPHALVATLSPYWRHSLDFYFHRTRLSGLTISPDGKLALYRSYRYDKQGHRTDRLLLRRISDGKLLLSRPFSSLRQLRWSPDGRYYSFVTSSRRKGSSLWLVERKTQKMRALLHGIRKLRTHIWSPTSQFIVYMTMRHERPTRIEKIGAKRLRGMDDRTPWYRHRAQLFAVMLQSGQSLRLTAGEWSPGCMQIRPDGKRMLLCRERPNYTQRPFHQTDLYELDFTTMKTRKLLSNLRWFHGAQYSPDGHKLLLLGGPSLFGHLGRNPNMPLKTILNDYEGDAFIYDLQRRTFEALSKTFKPHIYRAHWHPLNGKIYFSALDRTRHRLYQYNPDQETFTRIPTGVDITYNVAFARNSSQIAYFGQGIGHPGRLFSLDLFHPQPRLLDAPNQAWLSQLQLAGVQDFVAYSTQGVQIEGRVYTPPDFDPRKKYPAIVYYYGGTFPTPRYFDGSFAGQLWAAHGFVTYILQPSGAVGYGQKHASRHVNEWGSLVANEIIEATKQFLAAHPFVNPKQVGCIGASYGGFMTLSIITKTKLFAAAISHAGISNISSYWGAGYWGYWYSAVATANRYPWSHPHFFVQNSPLFSAHKITTPLLLIHGTADHNVPPAESFQMYTALRLLKKKVELVLFKGEGHGIRNRRKRKLWFQTILAWFYAQLKGQPLWWKQLYGTRQY